MLSFSCLAQAQLLLKAFELIILRQPFFPVLHNAAVINFSRMKVFFILSQIFRQQLDQHFCQKISAKNIASDFRQAFPFILHK